MPRSFLVRARCGRRAPDYARLDAHSETNGPCTTCRVLGVPLLLPEKAAPAQPWDRLPQTEVAQGASGPDLPEADRTAPRAGQAPSAPLKDSLHHLALRPLLVLPTRWPPILDPGRDQTPDRLLGAEQDLRPPGGFQCPRCRRPYLTLTGLARHRQLHCPLQAQRCFTCRFCDKEYASLGALKMHIRTHTLPCACATCGKAFSRPWLLQGHIRTHTGEKPYACSHCSRAFADRSNLRAHLQTHADSKRYRCRGCPKTFSRMSLLLRHEDAGCGPGP